MKDDAFTYAIIGAAMKVHRELGPRFMEKAYHRALALEFDARGIPFEREVKIPLVYEGKPLGVPFRADLLCDGRVIVEVKVLPRVGWRHRQQLSHYLKGSGLPVGLLLNFGENSLHVERVLR